MKRTKPTVSIIIVQYKVKELVLKCLRSIYRGTKNISYQIIVVDNDEKKNIREDLLNEFSNVIYLENENRGFGQGNNLGVRKASGKYLFFLNPDTTLQTKTVASLVNYLENNEDVGIVAPLLMHENKKLFELQGLGLLTPLKGIVALSFINKLFPRNNISRNYWLPDWDRTKVKEVDTVPGTAFMMRHDLFKKIGGFDEEFFLYFEEFDLCKRVRDLGYKICMIPDARIIHLWGKSTEQRNDIKVIFQQSRFYFFKKHYGILKAFGVELFTRTSKEALILSLVLFLNFFLVKIAILYSTIFIGDQGWFYLSARDLLLGKEFPLVGITSSHTWLHQGPLWTYFLALVLWVGRYNPLSGSYLSLSITLITTLLIYLLGKRMFSKRTALIASILFAFSPLVIQNTQMPYHTTPIPLFTLLYFYSLYKWISGNKRFLAWSVFFLAILYNLELASVVMIGPLFVVAVFGYLQNKSWMKKLGFKDILLIMISGIIPMLPVILYDITHGYKQTIVYTGWLLYQPFNSLHQLLSGKHAQESFTDIIVFLYHRLGDLLFLPSALISLLLVIFAAIMSIRNIRKGYPLEGEKNSVYLLWLCLSITIVAFIINKTPSDAYLPILFIGIFYLIGNSLSYLPKKIFYISASFIVFGLLLNIGIFIKHNYFIGKEGLTLIKREEAVLTMVANSKGKSFNIVGSGAGSEFRSFTMPYEYLSWYFGHPVDTNSKLIYVIEEKGSRIIIKDHD